MRVVEIPGLSPIWLQWNDNGRITNLSKCLGISETEVIQRALKYYEESLDNTIAYMCDQEQCEDCSADSVFCYHTTDIHHAANFEELEPGKFMEKE